MNKYSADMIRNVCLMAHGGAGKTSIAEAMLHNAKASDRFGKVIDGTTTTDYDPEEIRRGNSINTAVAPFEWNKLKFNIIDTPGYFDFVGEVNQGIRVADGALILVSARSGVTVGAENSWEMAKKRGLPAMFFVNKMDDENASFEKTLEELKARFGTAVVPFQYPIMEDGKLSGFIDVISLKAFRYDGDKSAEIASPAEPGGDLAAAREALLEAIAETDEALMEKYFGGEEFTQEEIGTALKSGVKNGGIVPVYFGSATGNVGVRELMDGIGGYFPSPVDVGAVSVKDAKGEDEIQLEPDENGALAALVFKTIADPFVGKLSMFRVYSGTVRADSTALNPRTGVTEKIGRLFILRGKKQIETEAVSAGDIGAVTKFASVETGDTLCSAQRPVLLEGIEFPKPNISMAVVPKAKGDEDKISTGLQKLIEEDPTFTVYNNPETNQLIISGIGEQHLDVITSKLKGKFGASVELILPKIPYRETIRKKAKVEGKHKKQSGGHGQYGHVWIEFEPGENEDLTFEETVFGGAVPRNYFPAVEKGLRESAVKGVLAGYPVVNLKATLLDGSYHPVDSSEMAFKIAASIAYKEGLKQAGPVLLEPIGRLEVIIPEANMGDIIGDINKRRGRILGMNPIGDGKSEVIAEIPMAETFKYATDLRSMTQARGSFTLEFERYEEAPANVAQAVIDAASQQA